jgi:hypothetical protein
LAISAIVPLQGYARHTAGMGVTGGVWIELDNFVIAPELSMRWDVEDPANGYFHFTPLEIGAFWIADFAQHHALFLGPGVGMHLLYERLDTERSVGSFVEARTEDTIHDDAFAFGAFGRVGFILFRGASASLVPSVDYAVTFADLKTAAREQAVRVNMALLLGGKRR